VDTSWDCIGNSVFFKSTDGVHSSVLHGEWYVAGHETHADFANDLACLMADNIWNEGK
jgi:hypothetical protein